MAQYTQIVRFMQVFGRGKRKKTGAHLTYHPPVLTHFITILISNIMSRTNKAVETTKEVAQTKPNDTVILTGVTLEAEKAKGSGTLWSLPDGSYEVNILSRRDDFKGGKVAVITSMGITTIASLFQFATPEVVKDHTSAKNDFQFMPSYKMTMQIAKGAVTKLAKAGNHAVPGLPF
jgi:hypothetical protein